jgi:hypothetical protein
MRADFRGDREAGWNGNPEKVHFSKVGTLAAEKVFHVGSAFGHSITEGVDILIHIEECSKRAGCYLRRTALTQRVPKAERRVNR